MSVVAADSAATATPRSRKGIAWSVMPTAIVAARPSGNPAPDRDPCIAQSATSAAIRHAPTSAPQGRTGRFVSVSITP